MALLNPSAEPRVRFLRIRLVNFLSYRDATIEFDDFIALVGSNASGKSNAVAAIKLLREIPFYGLPAAIARHGGFDQLRHRSGGRSLNPSIRLEFQFDGDGNTSFYEIKLVGLKGKRYEVQEEAAVYTATTRSFFKNDRGSFSRQDSGTEPGESEGRLVSMVEEYLNVPQGQSVIAVGGHSVGIYLVSEGVQECSERRPLPQDLVASNPCDTRHVVVHQSA